jgi:agmatinase
MIKYKVGVPFTFMGCENPKLDEADVVVLPIPYEGTAHYKGGTRFGPQLIINASYQTETFDSELKKEIIDQVQIFTAPRMESNLSSPKNMIDDVYKGAKQIIAMDKFLVVLGGEHSISSGIARAYCEKFKNLTVLQIDAHTDLRDEYESTKYSHACTMRRIRELGVNVVQVGIRSYSLEEHEYVEKNKIKNIFWVPFKREQINDIINACTENIFITIDADGFDPSIIPATGSPVPGGLQWYESLDLFKKLFKERNVVGFDFVELSSKGGEQDTRSEDTAATLIYRLIGYKFLR